MKLLVTGGCGFIGSNFIGYWLKNHSKDTIVNLDKLTYAGHLSSTQNFLSNKRYRFVKGDICNTKLVKSTMKNIDIVVHFAAESHVDRSITGPSIFLKTNVLGTQVLLEAALQAKVKRFHQVSTDEVFGSLPLGTKTKFSEDATYDPRSPYAAAKAGSDHIVRAYFHTYGLPITITNCANNFGPFQDPEKFIPRFITNLIDDKPLPIYGDGKYVRDWLHVEDHIRAIEAILQSNEVGQTYLVGGQLRETNNLEVAKKLLEIFDKDDSYLKFVKDRPGHDRRYAIDWSKIKKQLKWRPKYDFDTWLVRTVEWYKENETWWRPLKAQAEKLYAKTGQK